MSLLRVACKSAGVPEIFRSIQGEGRNIGRIRTFVRLSECNLRCVWCDTPYTWNWEGTRWRHVHDREGAPHKFSRETEIVEMCAEDIASRVAEMPAAGVVITGGEPLVQKRRLPGLIEALRRLPSPPSIEVETNGTIAPGPELAGMVDLFMVSPKLGHAGNRDDRALRADVLTTFAALPQAAFKFVAAAPEDVGAVSAIAERFAIAPGRIYIMPLGTDSETVTRTGAAIVDAVIAAGFNYSDRLHVHLFGNTRGT